ncbi:hypothetical protein K2W90_00405 [Candidatus Babeliales bacterium]|nr:hypothetical protein [Candidatus Babeliales bacterium]
MVTKYALLCIIFLTPNLMVGGLFTDYAKQTPEETIAALEKKQIDAPHDPYVNYNLGVAQYKAGNYAQAKQNFGRVFSNKKIDEDFRVRAGFNAGNSGYRGALESLGSGWEQRELDDKLLEHAIAQTKAAIRSYDDVIKLDDEHEPAKHNKKLAEELLKKLEEKKKQQEQDKQDKKDDKEDKKDDKKDQQDKQDKDKNNKNDQQDKQDKQDKKDQKKDEQGKQDKDKSDQQDNKDKQDQGDQDEGDKDKSDQQGYRDEDKKDQQDADKSDEQKEQEQKEREQQEKEQQEKEAQANADQQKEQEAQQAAAQAAQAGEEDKEDEGMQKRGVRALLENLDEDESKKQKGFIVQQVKGGKASERQGQKPW